MSNAKRKPSARARHGFVCECGGKYEIEERKLAGMTYELYACPRCGDTIFTAEQVRAYRKVHALAQVAKKLEPLTLRHVGNSINATVPRELAELGFREGRRFLWEIDSPTRITLHLLADDGRRKRPATSKHRER